MCASPIAKMADKIACKEAVRGFFFNCLASSKEATRPSLCMLTHSPHHHGHGRPNAICKCLGVFAMIYLYVPIHDSLGQLYSLAYSTYRNGPSINLIGKGCMTIRPSKIAHSQAMQV